MIRVLKISLFAIWCTLAMVLIGSFLFHAVYYVIDGTTDKFLSPMWIGILVTTVLSSGSFFYKMRHEWGKG